MTETAARCLLFTHLARAERAGLPLNDTIRLLKNESLAVPGARLDQFRDEVAAGVDIAAAGLNSGLFLPWEAHLLCAAQSSGQLASTCSSLAGRYRGRADRLRRLKGNMLLPLLLFFLAIFVAPVPALYRGEISGLEYLLFTLGRLLLFLGGILLLSHGWKRLEAEESESSMFRLLLHIPVAGSLIREQQKLYYLQNLSLLLTAGLPAFTALETAALGVRHPALRERFTAAADYCRGGMDVAAALERCGALEKPDEVALAKSGEFSGQLDTMIRHQANLLEERLDRRYALVTEWLPRFLYLLVLAYIVAG